MKHFSSVQYVAIGLIILSLLMNYAYFRQVGNFNSPIIEYEFVKNEQDVKNIFTENNEFKKAELKGVRDQNIIDYAYMLFYTALLILSFHNIRMTEKKNIYVLGVIFSFIALAGDIIENIQMFQISELLVNRLSFSKQVETLFIITRIKWLCLALAMFIMSVHYYKYKFTGKLFAFISALPVISVLALMIFKDSGNDFVKIFTTLIILSFVTLMIWIFISSKIDSKISFYKKQ